MRTPTPAKRLRKVAAFYGVTIDEFSPGLRVWSIRAAGTPYSAEPLAFGVPHEDLRAKIQEVGKHPFSA
jgi:hypothetical protein